MDLEERDVLPLRRRRRHNDGGALRSGQDKLNLSSKVLRLFLLEFNQKNAGGWAGWRVSLSLSLGGGSSIWSWRGGGAG